MMIMMKMMKMIRRVRGDELWQQLQPASQPASQSVAEQMPVLGLRYTTIIINFSPITS